MDASQDTLTNYWKLPPSPPNIDKMWQEIKTVKYEAPNVHIACTRLWYLLVKKNSAYTLTQPFVALSHLMGVDVFITDDVQSPEGYEVREGRHP